MAPRSTMNCEVGTFVNIIFASLFYRYVHQASCKWEFNPYHLYTTFIGFFGDGLMEKFETFLYTYIIQKTGLRTDEVVLHIVCVSTEKSRKRGRFTR